MKNRRILGRSEIGLISAVEYVGALSDFTGEIGRLGVAAASKRDIEEILKIKSAMVCIMTGLLQIDCGSRFNKKIEATVTNLKKIEDLYYELILLQRGGKSSNINRQEPELSSNIEDT